METVQMFIYFEEINSFKSYYVVWKRLKNINKMEKTTSLNRTMQYGNDEVFKMCFPCRFV